MPHMTMFENPLTGDWMCAIAGTSQCYACESKRDATRFCADVNADIDAGLLMIDEYGAVTYKRWLVVRTKSGNLFVTPDITKRKPGRIAGTFQTREEAEDHLRWLETPSADSPF